MEKNSVSSREKPEGKTSAQVTPKLKFWIDLAKWFIVSVALVVATKIVDTGLKDRAADLAEMKFYDNYITDLIVLNPSPVNKVMLAEYIICVAPSEKIRERWQAYYDSVYPDYLKYIEPLLLENADLESRLDELRGMKALSPLQEKERGVLEANLEKNRQILYPAFRIPGQQKEIELKINE